jgi:hypothetical protein
MNRAEIPNYLYQGSIEVGALVNGKPYVVKIGTVSNPVSEGYAKLSLKK